LVLGVIADRFGKRTRLAGDVVSLLARGTKVAVVLFGIVTALGTVGINVSALVAGLGLTGFALGFALKDALSNVLAGVLSLSYRPFRPGEHIEVRAIKGWLRTLISAIRP
jgi:small conductance mechanosensitive channel